MRCFELVILKSLGKSYVKEPYCGGRLVVQTALKLSQPTSSPCYIGALLVVEDIRNFRSTSNPCESIPYSGGVLVVQTESKLSKDIKFMLNYSIVLGY